MWDSKCPVLVKSVLEIRFYYFILPHSWQNNRKALKYSIHMIFILCLLKYSTKVQVFVFWFPKANLCVTGCCRDTGAERVRQVACLSQGWHTQTKKHLCSLQAIQCHQLTWPAPERKPAQAGGEHVAVRQQRKRIFPNRQTIGSKYFFHHWMQANTETQTVASLILNRCLSCCVNFWVVKNMPSEIYHTK